MKELMCVSGVELLMDYLEGVLPDETRLAIDAHVASCPKCTAFVASYRATPRILRDATETSVPEELQESLKKWLRSLPGE
jgi:anti-sigma factor RsiW